MLFGMAIGEFMISLMINSKPWPTEAQVHARIAQAVTSSATGMLWLDLAAFRRWLHA